MSLIERLWARADAKLALETTEALKNLRGYVRHISWC